ncbi:PQQ-like beta-propeller repeat protein [Sulfidibacter corallicola]|uniref:PQQ-like beta-propeller repeat protein n=1 Tax=Sulfidibacter corallicola TaxID=2818388 RepID=A0A8A4TLU3_SULCO|nr:PQQ-binding-like beta-propeller repeat protein [Sulfidibacter corallicola]QTD50437.1 PQQ-like beta-propeller repeat protein [Sulfidibacter corallicola]
MRMLVWMIWCSSALMAGTADWPQWRGPARDGTAPGFQVPTKWPEALRKQWSVPVGQGYGSPVTAGDRAFLITSSGEKERVLCVDLTTGKEVWSHAYEIDFKENSYALKFGKGPFSTPLWQQGRLYTVGITGQVFCFEAKTGNILWHKAFDGVLNDQRHYFCGNSVSPIAFEDLIIVHVGNETQGLLTAYHGKTGKQVWQWRGDIPGYASPILAKLHGTPQLVTLTQNQVAGLNPKTGALLWQHAFQSNWRENIVSPVVFGDTVIVSGVERETTALQVRPHDGAWQVNVKWRNKDVVMYMSTPVLIDGTLYGLSHKSKGQFFAMDARTGETQWLSDGRMGMNAALVSFGPQIAGVTTHARLHLFKAVGDNYTPLKDYKLADSPIWAQPVFFKDKVLVKDRDHLVLWQFP